MREWCFIALANGLPRISAMIRLRALLLRLAGVRLGANACVMGALDISPRTTAKGIRVGAGVFINSSVRIAAQGGVTLSDFVMVGPNVSFETVTHSLIHKPGVGRDDIVMPIVVEREVWIGAGATILPGTTIGRGAVVAAGAVVNRDVPPMTLVGGIPAKYLKRLLDE
jgi:acetyltransferase-like isoleucine patch superfamily enzyme